MDREVRTTAETIEDVDLGAAKAGVWFTIANIVQKGAAFIYIPLYTRIVSTDQYGLWSLWQSWYQMLLIISSMNLHSAVFNNGMLKYKEKSERDRYTSSMIGLTFLSTLIVVSIVLAVKVFSNNTISLNWTMILLLCIQLLFAPPFNYWIARARYEYKYKDVLIVITIVSLLTPSIALLLMKTIGPKAESITLGYVIPSSVLGIFFCMTALLRSRMRVYDRDDWAYALSFNLPLIPYYFANVVLGQIDRVMIANICSEADAGVYALAYQVSLALNILIAGINSALVPWMYSKMEEGSTESIANTLVKLSSIIGLASVMLVACAPEILIFLGPAQYHKAVWIIPPVVLGTFAVFYQTCFCNIEFYYAETRLIAPLSIIIAVINILLNYMLISSYGYIAAGWTTLICYILLTVGHYFLMRRAIERSSRLDIPISSSKMTLVYITVTLCCLILMVLYTHTVLRFGFIAIIALISMIVIEPKDYRRLISK